MSCKAVNWNSISQLLCVTCHMGSYNVTCHPTQVITPCFKPGWYSIYLLRRDGKLSWPRWLVTYQDGLPTPSHPSTNPAAPGRESNSQPVDHKSDAITATPPSHQFIWVLLPDSGRNKCWLIEYCLFAVCQAVAATSRRCWKMSRRKRDVSASSHWNESSWINCITTFHRTNFLSIDVVNKSCCIVKSLDNSVLLNLECVWLLLA